jgi:retinol-binding protein 3
MKIGRLASRGATLFIALSAAPVVSAPARSPAVRVDAATRNVVIDALVRQLNRIYVFPDVAKRMEAAIRARQARREYDSITDGEQLAKVLTADLRQVRNDSHLSVQYSAAGIAYDSESPPSPADVARFRESGRLRNYEYRKVERLDGGVGLLQVDGFYPEEWTQDTVAAAMSFLANSEAIILDLRQNHGGAAGTLLMSYFFDEPQHLSDHVDRAQGTTQQFWTYPVVPGRKLADKDVYILTSSETVSAPEALAFDMQRLKRATIVGEATPGGANPTTMFRLTDTFSAAIPFARTVHTGVSPEAEGAGVKPDVAVPAGQALLTAHLMALRTALKRHGDEPEIVAGLQRTIAEKEAELQAIRRTPTPGTKGRAD